VHFRPAFFEPTFHKHARTPCGGCQIHVTDRRTFRAVETGVAVIDAARRAGPAHFAWRQPPYEYEHTLMPIDILYGSAGLREGLERGASVTGLSQAAAAGTQAFLPLRQRFLRY